MPSGSPRLPRLAAVFVLLSLFGFLLEARSQVVISELMAQNVDGTIVDEDGEHSDWLELHNTGTTPVTLNGWYLTDDRADLQKWRFPLTAPVVTLAADARLLVWCSGKNRKVAANNLHTNFSLEKSGEYLGVIRADGFQVEFEYAPQYPPQFNNGVFGLGNTTTQQELLSETASGKAQVATSEADFQTNFAGWNSSVTFNDSAWQSGQSGFGFDTTNPPQNLVGPQVSATGNLQTLMQGATPNASAFIRYIVNVPNPSLVTGLTLKMRYDDGFVCYLNGHLIAQSNAPSSGVTWNSTAADGIDRADALAGTEETFIPENAKNFLVAGDNVLAFQLLNDTAASETALLRPQLFGGVLAAPGYLASPTPRATNAAAVTNLGPAISQVTDQPTPPTGGAASEPLLITAKVVPTLRPLASADTVVLKLRIMYAAETSLTMVDDGTNGDVAANDFIYTAQVPTTATTAGQMIRWRVEAKDNTDVFSYDPPYPFPSRPTATPAADFNRDIDQYHGTVANQPALVSSKLPVLHWFVAPGQDGNTRSTAGASCSFFYEGRFYDNVRVDLHGQSSSGFPVNKKSHNVNFTKTNRFKWKEGQPSVRSFNLLTPYADKTKTRNLLAWDAWAKSGHIMSHWCEQIRVQQNGGFWGVYDMVEDGNEDMLERFGFNTFDALYKVYDTMDSTAQAEQKTREDVDATKSDYQAMLTGLVTSSALATRRQYAYDNIDIGGLVNAHAVHALINNNDWGHKNYYMFRNTTGTGEWSVLPWDQDLSSGHTWQSSPNYFSDEIDSQRALRNGANNRLRQLMYDSPEMNRMFVRRMRTLMDEFYVSGTATTGFYETRISEIMDRVDPMDLPAGVKSDQQLDFEKWGFWVNSGGGAAIAFTDSRAPFHTARAQADRLIIANPVPTPYPGSATGSVQGTNTTFTFVNGRRRYLYNLDNQNPASGADRIPTEQLAVPTGLTIETVEFNPASGNGEQEYFIIKNSSTAFVDVSGWHVTGVGGATTDTVDYVFRGGTVIPPFTGTSAFNAPGDVHTGRLHVVRNPAEFRARTLSPKRGEFRYIVGPFNGRLSARGGTLELRNKANEVVATNTWEAAPTASQTALRVTELNYNPTAPTAAEAQALPSVNASNFEFIELTNTGETPLDLTGARFDKGVTFTFPSGFSLEAGARCVVVANQAAFQLRFGTTFNIAGEYDGNLDNNGETIRLLDGGGEEVMEFRYDPDWYGLPDVTAVDGIGAAAGYSFVTRTSAPAYDSYENPVTWALSRPRNGTPGGTDAAYSSVYYGWLHDHFTPVEQATALATPGEDADGDGRNNFNEYTQGTNPRVTDTAAALVRAVVTTGADRFPAVRFTARAATLDVEWIVEASSDGVTWRVLAPALSSRVAVDTSLDEITYRDSEAAGPGTRMFRVHAKYLTNLETPALTIENHAPVAGADSANTRTQAVSIPVLSNDNDADNDTLSVRSVSIGTHGSAAVNGDGSITYTPDATFLTAGGDTFTYVVGDAFGGEVQGTVTIAITNTAPVANNDTALVRPGPVSIAVTANDTDVDGNTLSVASTGTAAHGTVAINGSSVVYTAAGTFAGSDSFTYTVGDGFGGSATATVTVTNTAPHAANDIQRVVGTTASSIAVTSNDLDPDPGQVLIVTIATNPTNGTATVEGTSIRYTAGTSFTGTDSLTYMVSDGFGGTATAVVEIVDELLAAPTGLYRGLVSDEAQASVGTAEVKLTAKGQVTAQVWHFGERFGGKGLFNANGVANLVLKGRKGASRTLTLELAAEDDQITGSVGNGSSANPLKLKRFTADFGPAAPCPQTGRYTAVLPPDPTHAGEATYPQGDGFATMTVSSSGKVKAKGKLGDATAFIIRSTVDQDGVVLMHTALYKQPKGFLCGEASFVTGDPNADQRGVLTWRKPQQKKASSSFPAGFSGSIAWQASRFTALVKGAPIFGPGVSAATITVQDEELVAPVAKSVTITSSGISLHTTGTDELKLELDSSSGLFSGSYAHPRHGRKQSFGGVLLQKQALGRGTFSGVGPSGESVTGHWTLAPQAQ